MRCARETGTVAKVSSHVDAPAWPIIVVVCFHLIMKLVPSGRNSRITWKQLRCISLSFLFPSQQCQDNDAISKPLILEGGRLLILRNHYFVTCRNSYYTSITCFHFYIINFSPVFLFFFCFQLRENTKDTYF